MLFLIHPRFPLSFRRVDILSLIQACQGYIRSTAFHSHPGVRRTRGAPESVQSRSTGRNRLLAGRKRDRRRAITQTHLSCNSRILFFFTFKFVAVRYIRHDVFPSLRIICETCITWRALPVTRLRMQSRMKASPLPKLNSTTVFLISLPSSVIFHTNYVFISFSYINLFRSMRYRAHQRAREDLAIGSSQSRAIDVSSKRENLRPLPGARSSAPPHAASIVPTSSASNRKAVPFLLALLPPWAIYRGSQRSRAGKDQRAAR